MSLGRGLTRLVWALYGITLIGKLILATPGGIRAVIAAAIFMAFNGVLLWALLRLIAWVAKGFKKDPEPPG
jgi:hypothetical protein